jgi:hypothetical protein
MTKKKKGWWIQQMDFWELKNNNLPYLEKKKLKIGI